MSKSLKDAVGGHLHRHFYAHGIKERSNKRIRREHRKIVRNALQELDQDIYDAQQYLTDQIAFDSAYDVYNYDYDYDYEDFMNEPESPSNNDYERDRDYGDWDDSDWGFGYDEPFVQDPPGMYNALPYSKRLLLQAYLETTYDKEDLVRMYLQKIDPDEIEELLEKAIEVGPIEPQLPTLGEILQRARNHHA